jgi:hypothetical protein
LCDSGSCRTTSDVALTLPCFGACVALQYAPWIAQNVLVGYARDVEVDGGPSRGHDVAVCYVESRTEMKESCRLFIFESKTVRFHDR